MTNQTKEMDAVKEPNKKVPDDKKDPKKVAPVQLNQPIESKPTEKKPGLIGRYFNSHSIEGRANVAKATFAGMFLAWFIRKVLIVTGYYDPKKSKSPEKST